VFLEEFTQLQRNVIYTNDFKAEFAKESSNLTKLVQACMQECLRKDAS
jgi:hypothetical protein